MISKFYGLFVVGFLFAASSAFSLNQEFEGSMNNQIFTVKARLPVTRSKAFQFFTEKRFLEKWLAAAADVEPKVGGKYELFWEPENPEDNSTKGCHVTAIEQDNVLAFDWKGPVQFKTFMNNADPLTHVTVFFASCNGNAGSCTDVHLIHSGWRIAPNWEEAKQWQQRAWIGAFEELKSLASSPQP